MKSTSKVFILFILLIKCLVVSGVCGKSMVFCFPEYEYDVWICEISGQDTDVIQQELYECTVGVDYFSYFDIEVISGGEGVTLNLDLPSSIGVINLNNRFNTPIFVETSSVNYDLVSLSINYNEVFINHNDFFTYFPNLKYFYAEVLGSNLMPFFTQNINLIGIAVYRSIVVQESNLVIDKTIVGGLDKLLWFYWHFGSLTKLMPDSFNGTYRLKYLGLYGNSISELYDCTFEGLQHLIYLDLSGNDITKVGKYTFIGLENLEQIYLENNPSFPLSPLTLAKKITKISLDNYNPAFLSPEIFQQFPVLSYLSLEYITFNCTCETEWISILRNDYNIDIYLDSDSYCLGNPGFKVYNSSLYVNCNNPSYQCFDHSIICSGNNTWYRVDTENGCNCTYPPERAFYNDYSFVCSDIDECEDSSICENSNCTNIIGSYTCDCHEGFVNFNETFCNDANECDVDNGDCDQNCTNAIGTYECTCFEGYSMQGLLCADIDDCVESNGNCLHNCNNSIGSFECSCFEGFAISYSNSSDCELIDTGIQILNFGETEFILVVFGVVVFVLIIMLVLIMILLLFCFCKRRWSHIPKQIPAYNPTIAELDKVKATDSTLIENQLFDSGGASLELLKDTEVSPQV